MQDMFDNPLSMTEGHTDHPGMMEPPIQRQARDGEMVTESNRNYIGSPNIPVRRHAQPWTPDGPPGVIGSPPPPSGNRDGVMDDLHAMTGGIDPAVLTSMGFVVSPTFGGGIGTGPRIHRSGRDMAMGGHGSRMH